MNLPAHPTATAEPARKRTPHGSAPKLRRRVAARLSPRITSQKAEALLMRLVGRLAVDVKDHPQTRTAHGHFVLGSLAMLEALGLVPPPRLHIIRTACNDLFDGALTLQDVKAMRDGAKAGAASVDADYLRTLAQVRRAGRIGREDEQALADRLCLMPATVRRLLDRMETDGVLHAADLFGCRLVKGEAQP